MRTAMLMLALSALMLPATSVAGQKPSTYPARNQSAEQQATDDAQCLAWAKQSTGVDPAALAATPAPAPAAPQGERLRGAARGAAGGALIGEVVDGDSSHGASVGAAAGVLAGGARARRNRAAQVQQGQVEKEQTLSTYYRAYGACMQGRGYTVN